MTEFKIMDRVIYGDQNFMIPAHMNHGKFAIDRMLRRKEKIALINGVTGEQITFGELVQRIVNTAGFLTRLGVKRDEVVAICSENRTEFLITAIAVWCSGATLTFLNAGYSKNEIVHTMNISKPKYIFLSPDTYKKYYETIVDAKLIEKFVIFGNTVSDPNLINFDELTKVHVDVDSFQPPVDVNVSGFVDSADGWGISGFDPDFWYVSGPTGLFMDKGLARTALILYSSGTTGLPKGAKLTHLNLITAGNQPHLLTTKDSRCLTIIPWSSTYGIFSTMDELLNNRTVIYLLGFKEEQYLRCIEQHKAGLLVAVPPIVVTLAKSQIVKNYDTSSVESILCGGAPSDLAIMTEFRQKFPNLLYLLQVYGMTEATGALTRESIKHFRPGSIGRIVLGNIIKVADVETGKTLGPRQEGELRVKGHVLFGGYIGKNISDDLDEDDFFKTGDIGYFDEDGYFYFVDRIKEIIKYKTLQVAPSELEAILLQHPAVKDAGVVGKPDAIAGELPTAFVVKKPGIAVTSEELIDFVAAKVSHWKQLRGGVYFIEEIPKVLSGKILRRVLRDLLKKPSSKI